MKIIIQSFLLFIIMNSFAQHPKILVEDAEIINHKISSLFVILDSAGSRYQLPFDTVKWINYNKQGKEELEIGFTSDASYTQNKVIYQYYQDSIKLWRIDSSFNGPKILLSVDTTYEIRTSEKGELASIKYYPWSNLNKLDWTKKIEYNSKGVKTKEIIKYEENTSQIPGVTFSIRGKTEYQYFYDNQDRLEKIIEKSIKPGEEKIETEIHYSYEKNKRIEITDTEDFWGNKLILKKEIFTDNEGKKTKVIEFDKTGKIRFATVFNYYVNGLLKEEIGYTQDNEFAYRFVTFYKMEK